MFEPLSNEALRRVMSEFLAAEKQGRVKIIGPPAPVGGHDVSPTRTLKVDAGNCADNVAQHHPAAN